MRTFLVLICSLALACAASGGQEENKSKKPPPKKKQAQSSQHSVTAGGEPHEKVDPRQLMRQAQDDPSAKTKQKMKGSQSQQAAGGGDVTQTGILSTPVGTTEAGEPASGGVAGAQKTKKLKGSATNAAGSSPAVQLHQFSDTTFKPTTVGRPTTVGAFTPKMGKPAGGHYTGKPTTMVGTFIPKMGKPTTVSKTTGKPAANAGGTNYPGRNFDSLAFRTSIPAATQPGKATGKAAGAGKPTTVGKGVPINQIKQYGGDQASQGQGKPASGKKKGQKVSPTPIPQ
jgi:hypothetical protein